MSAHIGRMLEDYLDKFSTDETSVCLHLGQNMHMENSVVSGVSAEAIRVGEDEDQRIATLSATFADIQDHHRDDVLSFMDDTAAGLKALAAAAYSTALDAWSTHILAIEQVEAFGADRGTGISLALVAATLENMSSGRGITAVLEPCPFRPEKLTAHELRTARKKLFAHWGKLGFARVSPRSKYMVLETRDYRAPEGLFV